MRDREWNESNLPSDLVAAFFQTQCRMILPGNIFLLNGKKNPLVLHYAPTKACWYLWCIFRWWFLDGIPFTFNLMKMWIPTKGCVCVNQHMKLFACKFINNALTLWDVISRILATYSNMFYHSYMYEPHNFCSEFNTNNKNKNETHLKNNAESCVLQNWMLDTAKNCCNFQCGDDYWKFNRFKTL